MTVVTGSTDIPRTMGRGLAELENLLPARPATPTAAQNAVTSAVAVVGDTAAGQASRLYLERVEANRGFIGRNFYVSARQREAELRRAQGIAVAAGIAASLVSSGVAAWAQKSAQGREAEASARAAYQYVRFASMGRDGAISPPNEALSARVLDAFGLSENRRRRVVASTFSAELSGLGDCRLDEPGRIALAHYVFHARANAFGLDLADDASVPVFMRLGMSISEARRFARDAHQEYLAERSALTFHYAVLQSAVGGIGLKLEIPFDRIQAAAARVTAFNPYDQARAENRKLLAAGLNTGFRLAMVAGTGHPGPAMSIAASAASALFGRPEGDAATRAALEAYQQQQ
ncbi:MAG: hypothetical protein HOV87_21710 [Catenulispora sp.]|nr:hypothetical protein [Catenulispora sp.]